MHAGQSRKIWLTRHGEEGEGGGHSAVGVLKGVGGGEGVLRMGQGGSWRNGELGVQQGGGGCRARPGSYDMVKGVGGGRCSWGLGRGCVAVGVLERWGCLAWGSGGA